MWGFDPDLPDLVTTDEPPLSLGLFPEPMNLAEWMRRWLDGASRMPSFTV